MGRNTALLATAVATLLAAAAAAQAQDVVRADLGEGANPESSVCTYPFTASNIKWCLNANGNLVSLQSPGTIEHMRIGTPAIEGYILCVSGAVKAYDTAYLPGSGWGPPAVIAAKTATGITIRRKTLDGLFQLDQKWSRDNTERDLTLQMTLKNLGPAAVVELGRVADFNVDIGLDGLFTDLFDRTRNTLWFRDPVNGRDGVTMKLLTLNPNYLAIVADADLAPRCIYPQLAFPGGPRNVMGHARFIFGALSSGSQKVVKLGYRVE
jgi:hypothetical protein